MSQVETDKDKDKEEIKIDDMNEAENPEDEVTKTVKKPEEAAVDVKDEEIKGLKNQIQRLAAEFDNYKKRTVKEKERIYSASIADAVACFLPVLDNVERALIASEKSDDQCIREGIQLIQRQMHDILSNLGVEPIETVGKTFNPGLHEAVMHIEDDAYGENEIVEEFQKGYIYRDELVIRHSVVKVAN